MTTELIELRKKVQEPAKKLFVGATLPSLKNENYKSTSLRDLQMDLEPVLVSDVTPLDFQSDVQAASKVLRSARPLELSGANENTNYVFTDILSALRDGDTVLKSLLASATVEVENDYFNLLNLSKWQNGFFLHLPKGVKAQMPVRGLHYFDLESKSFFSRTILVVEEGAELTFTDEWSSNTLPKGSGTGFYSGLVEVYAKKNAKVHYSSVQNFDESVQHFIRQRFVAEEGAEINIAQVHLGGGKGQLRLDADSVGERAEFRILGATRGQNDQHFDFWINSNHSVPHTRSELLYYTVMAGRSRSVFNGNIKITEKASQTDASQRNRNLFLSNEAVIDSVPKLEISTDDVKCAHGATVSSVSEDALYYLMSRGISKNEATQMIVDGFTEPVIEKLPTSELRERVRKIIQEKGL